MTRCLSSNLFLMMKIFLSALVMMVLTTSLFGQANGDQVADLMASASRLREANNEALAITKYEAALKLNPENYEALHSVSLLYSRVGNRFSESDQELKTEYFNKAKDYAEKAIQLNPTDAEGQYVMAVALSKISLVSDAKARMAVSKDIKKFAETAIRYNPKHSGAWDALGRWNSKVANLSISEKAAASLLFGGVPEGASNENAVRCFQNALAYEPNYILYMYDLATAYYKVKQVQKCRDQLNALLKLQPITIDDPEIQKEARLMLASLK